MRVIFMGTPEFSVPTLQALIDSPFDVIAVYSQPPRPAGRGMKLAPSPVQLLAEQHAIPVYTPASLKSMDEQEKFSELKADVAVVVAYGLILPKAILRGTRLGCVNIHPSSLPRWRGAAPIQRTIMAGDKTTEICIMQMDEGLDTGPVLTRKSYTIAPATTAGQLHDQLAQEAPKLLVETLSNMEAGRAHATKQSDAMVTYADKISKEEAKLDFTLPAKKLLQKILGLSPFPGAYYEENGERIKVLDATLDGGPLEMKCADGNIYPTQLQRAGGKRVSVQEFLAGQR